MYSLQNFKWEHNACFILFWHNLSYNWRKYICKMTCFNLRSYLVYLVKWFFITLLITLTCFAYMKKKQTSETENSLLHGHFLGNIEKWFQTSYFIGNKLSVDSRPTLLERFTPDIGQVSHPMLTPLQ